MILFKNASEARINYLLSEAAQKLRELSELDEVDKVKITEHIMVLRGMAREWRYISRPDEEIEV